jgi:hypothetical protein
METISAAEYKKLIGGALPVASSSRKRASPEEDLQRACVAFAGVLRSSHPILDYLFHPANGGKRPPGEAGKLKALGVRPGVPDLMLPLPSPSGRWRGLALELKAPSGRLAEDQRRWLDALQMQGWLVGVIWNFEEFQEFLELFLERPLKYG